MDVFSKLVPLQKIEFDICKKLEDFVMLNLFDFATFVEASNVINDPKCYKGPNCNNF